MAVDKYYRVNLICIFLAFAVITLGAFVRLSDAGLGCPDWPGCYGHIGVPQDHAAAEGYQRPLEQHKAWKEMAHRYLAGAFGLLILAMLALAWSQRKRVAQQVVLPVALLGLVIFQAMLGMWTVTLLLKPLVVSAHLLGGMSLLALLVLSLLRQGQHFNLMPAGKQVGILRFMAALGLVVLTIQIFLGAWTSSNYAALACTDFPTCHGQWWPQTDYKEAYTLWRGLGVNYEFGVLDSVPRATIHMVHRLGALITTGVLLVLAALLFALGQRERRWSGLAIALIMALALQVALGITAVVAHLPLPVAVAHNGGAALLLCALMSINHASWRASRL